MFGDEDMISVTLPSVGHVSATRDKIGVRRDVELSAWDEPLEIFIAGLRGDDLKDARITVDHDRNYGDCYLSAYVEGWLDPDEIQQTKIDAAWVKEDAKRAKNNQKSKEQAEKDKLAKEIRDRKELARLKKKYES